MRGVTSPLLIKTIGGMKTWYSIKAAAAGGDTAEISVYDYIGYYGVSAVDFLKDVKAIDAPNIKVSINSPGGDVFDAIAMVNGLRLSGKKITTVVMGIAACAARFGLSGSHFRYANTMYR